MKKAAAAPANTTPPAPKPIVFLETMIVLPWKFLVLWNNCFYHIDKNRLCQKAKISV
jgi:hypothetical protein